jgi:hypothetical protein
VYTNTTGASTPNFFLARLTPGGPNGRFLALAFFDIGDLATFGGTTTLSILPPPDSTGGAPICTQWTFNGSPSNPPPSGAVISGCTVSGITNSYYPGGFNGALVSVRVLVPGSYTCSVADPFGCWFKVHMSYSGGDPVVANDTTTWDAVGGDNSP